ncbi:SHOCT domain-containing protein [uncultured Deinococcus sp.]|uniref:SHOCT domain-containing protein n=1 Tax=uncultured Deinococcus sp. TaxID=158789 RepID=UPI0025CE3FAC|nr:SHOCT domain-containing protein [uncultured Deinococcus sp.]
MGYGYGMGLGGLGWIGMVLFLALLIVGVVLLVRALGDQARPGGGTAHDRALGIARERYARGELTREQFEALRHDLGG